MVYDDARNLTWQRNANLAASNAFGVTGGGIASYGGMTWPTAYAWVLAMNKAG